jgi:hypothetical protein
MALHQCHATQIFDCISRTLEGQPGHSRLQASMPDEEELDCASHKRKTITWTDNAFLSSLGPILFLQEQIKYIIIITTRASLLWRASIGRKCTRTGPPTTANTWVCPSHPAPRRVQTSRMPMQTLRDRRLRRPPPHLHATCRRHVGRT